MKKFAKKMMSLALTTVACFTMIFATACGGDNQSSTGDNSGYDLRITYFDGGYGQGWITEGAERFEALTGKKVGLIPSSEFDCGADIYLQSGKNLSDIYVIESSMWKGWVKSGYLEPLDSVYDAEVDTASGKQKISDFMDQQVKGKYYLERKIGNGMMQPWALPLGATPNAMAYNCDVLEVLPHNGEALSEEVVSSQTGLWIAPPRTVSELKAFIDDVNAYNATIPEGETKYVPLGWCGKNANILFYAIYSWWAQAQGYQTSNYEGEGSFADFWNFGNTSSDTRSHTLDTRVFLQSGLQFAIDTLIDILVDEDTDQWKNTLEDVMSISSQDLQKTFVSNSVKVKPVLVFAASYLESETIKYNYLDSDGDGQRDVNFKFMPVPKLDGYEGKDVVYCSYEDVMVVPQKATNKELAKQFLAFMCNQDNLEMFTKETKGCMRPFNYDARNIQGGNFSEYTQGVFDLYYSSLHAFEYPINCTDLLSVSNVYRYERPTFIGNDIDAFVKALKTENGEKIMTDIYNSINSHDVSTWVKNYRLTVVQ